MLAACRANESAMEFPFDGRESNGALTYWMVDTLSQAGPNTTWQMVADRVAAKVHGQFERQMPMLQGEGDYRVFGADRLDVRFGVPVLEVNAGQRRIRVNAGEAHGLAAGTRFEVFPTMADADQPAKRQALVELTDVRATDAWADIVEPDGAVGVEVGSQAVMLNTSAVRVQRTVRVVFENDALRQQVEAEIVAKGQGFLALAGDEGGADFLVDLHPERADEFLLLDTSGGELPYLRPVLRVADADVVAKLVKRLVHLAQYRNVQMLDMPDASMAAKLDVTLDAKAISAPGDKIKLEITNTQDPNPGDPDDPERILNITLLALSSDWSIAQIYPSGAGQFEPLDPGKSISLEFEAYLPEGRDDSLDIIKVFATCSATNFRWLELPVAGRAHSTRPRTRALITDPLEQMLAELAGEKSTTPRRAPDLQPGTGSRLDRGAGGIAG